jgi:hypothetical protein
MPGAGREKPTARFDWMEKIGNMNDALVGDASLKFDKSSFF